MSKKNEWLKIAAASKDELKEQILKLINDKWEGDLGAAEKDVTVFLEGTIHQKATWVIPERHIIAADPKDAAVLAALICMFAGCATSQPQVVHQEMPYPSPATQGEEAANRLYLIKLKQEGWDVKKLREDLKNIKDDDPDIINRTFRELIDVARQKTHEEFVEKEFPRKEMEPEPEEGVEDSPDQKGDE